jgi:hypothetical protein
MSTKTQPVTPVSELTLDAQYFIATETKGSAYPAIQFSQYKNIVISPEYKTKISFVLDPEAVELMDLDQAVLLGLAPKTCMYYDENNKPLKKDMLEIVPEVRWVVLGRPQTNYVTAPDGIRQIRKGDKFKEMKLKSVAKLFLGAMIDRKLLLTSDGEVQIFTLKLNSLKTNLIISNDDEQKTLDKLNKALCKAYKVPDKKNWVTHLASIKLDVFADIFVGKDQSSAGPNLAIVGDAVKLAPDQQKLAFELGSSNEFQELLADPFGLAKRGAAVVDSFAAEGDGHPGYLVEEDYTENLNFDQI